MIKVGSRVYIVPEDTRYKPYYTEVVSIGKKYIHVKGSISESKFNISNHYSADYNDWNPRLMLYESERDYQIIDERRKLISKIENKLPNTSLEKLEQIYKLIL